MAINLSLKIHKLYLGEIFGKKLKNIYKICLDSIITQKFKKNFL